MSAVIACMHLKHNSWPTPHPSVIWVELWGADVHQRRADLTCNTPYSNTTVNGPITIAIRARFEYDSTTIRLRFERDTTSYEELCAFEQ